MDDAACSLQTNFSPRTLFELLCSDDFTVKTFSIADLSIFSQLGPPQATSCSALSRIVSQLRSYTSSAPKFSLITDIEYTTAINFCAAQASSTQSFYLSWFTFRNAFNIETNNILAPLTAANGAMS